MKRKNNTQFFKDLITNDITFQDYLDRFEKIALSIFEWVNLPTSMNPIYLEKCLYFYGQAALLKDTKYGFINTKCSSNGNINLYGLPNSLHCYSYEYQTNRNLYIGYNGNDNEYSEAILVQNNWNRTPTYGSMELFAFRLMQSEVTCDLNINAQKTPILLLVNEKQRFTMEQLYQKYEGNSPVIFGDKENLAEKDLRVLKTDAPFIADKLMNYKKEIWNEALTYLGINNIMVDKKERLITDEANSNNELINLNLQSYLAPRQLACEQFNEKFKLKGTDKEISVRVRSDLHNIIKNEESIVTKYNELKEVEGNGEI